jgi:hypothetical protein
VALVAAGVVLAGCGDDGDPATDDRTSVSWLDTDVCSLVPEERVAELIGADATAVPGDSDPRRPECEWTVPETAERLVLRLWQPPVPDELARHADRTTPVGDRTGYVEAEGRRSCTMHVAAEPAWLSVDLSVPRERSTDHLCDQVAPTADEVLAEVR